MLEFDTGAGRCEVRLTLECRHCDRTPIQGGAVRRIGELLEEFHGGAPNQCAKECGRAATRPAASVTQAADVSLRQEKTVGCPSLADSVEKLDVVRVLIGIADLDAWRLGLVRSACHGRLRHRDQFCEFAEVLGGGGEQEFVVRAARSS